jgi:hypothetical protein
MPGFLGDEPQFKQAYANPILASGKDLHVKMDKGKLGAKGAGNLFSVRALACV